MDWTMATKNKRQRKRIIQIFVKVTGSRAEMALSDKVSEIVKRFPTSEWRSKSECGRALRRSLELRLRGGGKHKDKKSRAEKKRSTSPVKLEQTRGEQGA